MIAQPIGDDYHISFLLGTVEITIPGKRNGKQLILFVSYLIYALIFGALFTAILTAMVGSVLREGKVDGWYVLLIPLFIGLIGLVWRAFWVVYLFLWQLGGMETISVQSNSLRIQKTIFGIGRTKEYHRDQIEEISCASPPKLLLAFTNLPSTQFEVERAGPLYARYGKSKRQSFGLGLGLPQAEKIAEVLKQRLAL